MKIKKISLIVSICLVLVLVASSVLAACAPAAPTAPTTPAPAKPAQTTPAPAKPAPAKPAPEPAPAPAAEVIKLKIACYEAANSGMGAASEEAAEDILRISDGRLDITYYGGETLLKRQAVLEGVRSGLADIGISPSPYYPEEFAMLNIYGLPGLATTAIQGSWWANELKDYWNEELALIGLYGLGWQVGYAYSFYANKKPIRTLDDLKGLIVRSPGGTQSLILEKMGAVPMTVGGFEQYDAMQKGTLDVTASNPWAIYTIGKLHELADPGYHLKTGGFGTYCNTAFMNMDIWNSLPEDIQLILNVKLLEACWKVTRERQGFSEEAWATAEAAGIEINTLNDADMQKLDEIIAATKGEVLAKIEAKGLPAKELWDKLMEFKSW